MANPPCMIEECPNAATFIGTFLNDGNSVTVCEEHFVDFAATILEALTDVPVTQLITLPPETFVKTEDDVNDVSDVPPTTSPESSEAGTESDQDDGEPEFEDWCAVHEGEITAHTNNGLDLEAAVLTVEAETKTTAADNSDTSITQ